MAIYVYCCPDHGEYEVTLRLQQTEHGVPKVWRCPVDVESDGVGGVFCDERSPRVLTVPNFIGGPTTGAGKE